MATVEVVTFNDYQTARLDLLAKEKEATRLRDSVVALRRKLPVTEVTKAFTFTTLDESTGKPKQVTLVDLFGNRSQLLIYHFMFDPDWDAGCSSCSLVGDSIPALEHLHSRSTTFVAVSRAPIEKIEAYKKRMGWTGKFPWVSSFGTDFNYDYHVSQDESVTPIGYNFKNKEELEARGQPWFAKGEQPGNSVFIRGGTELENGSKVGETGKIYHTYSTYSRGVEGGINTFTWLDMTLLGRQDYKRLNDGLGFKRRDEYAKEDLDH